MTRPTESGRENATLELIIPRLEEDGFEVFVRPPRSLLPQSLGLWEPDAVAVKGKKKIAIEVITGSRDRQAQLQGLREKLSDHPDWELRLVYAPPRIPEPVLPQESREVIGAHLARASSAFEIIGPAAALLTVWSAFEAAARAALPEELSKPQSASSLVEALAADDHITPEEAEALQRLVEFRNAAAHGQLDIPVTREDIDTLVDISRSMLNRPI